MKYDIELACPSSPEWAKNVVENFDEFLPDHANCERKASAMAMSFVAKYPNRMEIIDDLIATAIEELEHFEQVWRIMKERGVSLQHEFTQDVYVKQLIDACRSGREDRFMDRLLVAALVECRGAERFRMISEFLEDEELIKFYRMLGISEAKHCHIFLKMAQNYFPDEAIEKRLAEMVEIEGQILNALPLKPALH